MAYDRDKILEQALKVIEDEECVTVDEVSLYLPIHRATFYEWEFDKNDKIKDALNSMKVRLKKKMRRNWRNSDNPTLQIAEFKLIATDTERDNLSTSKVKQETDVNITGLPAIVLDFGGVTDKGNEGGDGYSQSPAEQS